MKNFHDGDQMFFKIFMLYMNNNNEYQLNFNKAQYIELQLTRI